MARKPRPDEVELTREFLDYLEALEARATDEICGVWFNRRGAAKAARGELTQWDMFRKQWAHVRPYASEELVSFFERHGRLSFTQYREQHRQAQRDAYAAWLEAA